MFFYVPTQMETFLNILGMSTQEVLKNLVTFHAYHKTYPRQRQKIEHGNKPGHSQTYKSLVVTA